jgi:hypoxanthine phosphoribosyltransferase
MSDEARAMKQPTEGTSIERPTELGPVVFEADEIAAAVSRVAGEIRRDFHGKRILMVGVLKGALLFLSDLMRELADHPLTIDFVVVSSYGSNAQGRNGVRLLKDLDQSPDVEHVLLVEDIVDEGFTLAYLLNNMRSRKAASVRSCALIDKPFRRAVDVKADYVGLHAASDAFLVGYGLDFQERFRNLPHIRQLQSRVPT